MIKQKKSAIAKLKHRRQGTWLNRAADLRNHARKRLHSALRYLPPAEFEQLRLRTDLMVGAHEFSKV